MLVFGFVDMKDMSAVADWTRREAQNMMWRLRGTASQVARSEGRDSGAGRRDGEFGI